MPTNPYDGINQVSLDTLTSWRGNDLGAVTATPEGLEQARSLYNLLQNAQANSTTVLSEQVFNANAGNWGPGARIPYELLRCSNCGMQVRGDYIPGDILDNPRSIHDCKVMHEIRERRDDDQWPYSPKDYEAAALGINSGDPIWCVRPASERSMEGVRRSRRVYGEGLPERLREAQAYRNELFSELSETRLPQRIQEEIERDENAVPFSEAFRRARAYRNNELDR